MNYILTIAIPVLNGQKYISKTIDSILAELQEGVELLVIDNNSTDMTKDIVNSKILGNKAARIKVFKESVNVDLNFERCIRYARGKYIWFVGDDDVICKGSVNKVLKTFNLHKMYFDYIFIDCMRYDRTLTKLLSNSASRKKFNDGVVCNLDLIEYVGVNMAFTPTTLIKKDIWEKRFNKKFIGTNWYVLANLLGNIQMFKCGYLGGKNVFFRDGSDKNSLNGKFLLMAMNLIDIILGLKVNFKSSKSQLIYTKLLNSIANKKIIYTIYSAKVYGYGLSLNAIRKALRIMPKKFFFGVVLILGLLIPKYFYILIFNNREIIRKVMNAFRPRI